MAVRGPRRHARRGGGDRPRSTSGCSRRRGPGPAPGIDAAPPLPCASDRLARRLRSGRRRGRPGRDGRTRRPGRSSASAPPTRTSTRSASATGPGSRTSRSIRSAARRASARRCSTRRGTGPASAAPRTSSSTRPRRAPTPTASTSARAPQLPRDQLRLGALSGLRAARRDAPRARRRWRRGRASRP